MLLDCIAFDNDIDINVMRLWKLVEAIKLEFFSYIVRYDEVECYLNDEECDHEGYVMWNKYGAFKIVNRAVFSSANFRLSKNRQPVKCNPIEYSIIMNRKEYDLVFQALKNYRLYMTKEQEVLSEKILDDLFYPEFDKLSSENDVFDEIVADAEEALANEPEINGVKSLNFR